MSKTTHLKSQGFTLLELLVVISIIAILASLSIGAVASAIESGRASKCASNLRQIGTAFQGYLGDNNNIMPQRFYGNNTPYFALLAPYAGNNTNYKASSIFVCPSQFFNNFPSEPSYGMNWYYDNANIAVVPTLSTTIMVAETLGGGTGSNRADKDSVGAGRLDPKRHKGTANYLFFDGHVDRLNYTDTVTMWGVDQGDHSRQSP